MAYLRLVKLKASDIFNPLIEKIICYLAALNTTNLLRDPFKQQH